MDSNQQFSMRGEDNLQTPEIEALIEHLTTTRSPRGIALMYLEYIDDEERETLWLQIQTDEKLERVLSVGTVDALYSLAYVAWSDARKNLKLIMREHDDGTVDWESRNARSIDIAQAEVEKKRKVLDEVNNQLRGHGFSTTSLD
jgi:hypothetical protein